MAASLDGEVQGAQEKDLVEPFTKCLNEKSLHTLACKFSETFDELARSSTQHFLTTPVTSLPTGKERGKFLAIDVGGSNLRVAFVELLGEDGAVPPGMSALLDVAALPHLKRSHEKAWPIEEHLKMDQAEDLFTWIGDCIAEVVTDALNEDPELDATETHVGAIGEELDLGITFSFPMTQESMSEATLMPMGKGFAITSDLNLGKMLLAGYSRHCEERATNGEHEDGAPSSKRRRLRPLPRLRIAAITNDTVATFASLAYTTKATTNSRVAMGLIVGTGTNATIPMRSNSLGESKRAGLNIPDGASPQDQTVVINTEWSVTKTGQPLFDLGINTSADDELDRNSEAPGFQPLEYMTSGRYLGEIVRLFVLDHFSKDVEVADFPPLLKQKNALSTTFLATVVAVAGDLPETLDRLADQLEEAFPSPSSTPFWTLPRAVTLFAVTSAVRARSAALIAAASVGLLDCVGEIHLTHPQNSDSTGAIGNSATSGFDLVIAYTGGLISKYPGWLDACQSWIDKLVADGGKRVVLKETSDGGIVGAAVLAGMMASREV